MKINISPQILQKPILAPTMQQSIEVLLLPVVELQAVIDNELQENPLLEVDEERTREEKEAFYEELQNRIQNIDYTRIPQGIRSLDDEKPEARSIEFTQPLEDHLLKQLKLELSDNEEVKIGELIIYNLDENGYLKVSCEEIAQALGLESAGPVESILSVIQNFEPVGIASRNLKECLLAQVKPRFNGESYLVTQLISHHLDDLGAKRYQNIAKEMNLSIEEVKTLAHKIAQLEPKPARNYRPIHDNIYIKPDLTIYKDDNEKYQVIINNENLPHLRVNSYYQKILAKPDCSAEEKDFIREKMKNAITFIKSIEQRQNTINKIGDYLVKHQKDFFEHGLKGLKPMTLKDIALAVDRNESTISRAINNKFVDSPQGLFALKFFFSQGIESQSGESVSSRCVKEEIKIIIDEENNRKPLSDQDIYHYLANKGMNVSRRTVAKYRQAMKILPSHLRKV